MAAEKNRIGRKDKEILWELEGQVKDIRQQLNEQLKCLDIRVENQVALVSEIQEYFRRRAEVELEYSRNLDKLAKNLSVRHKAERQKRDQWQIFSTYACWQHLIQRTKQRSKHHAVLSELYSNNMVNRFQMAIEDVQRIYRRCREIGIEGHDELLKVLHELHASMKTYQIYHGEMKQADGKVQLVKNQQNRLEQVNPKEKLEKSKKYRLLEKELQKRMAKYNDANLRAVKARNEYLLGMDAANAAIRKYFADDMSDLIDCMDFGFHSCTARAFLMYSSAEETMKSYIQQDVDAISKCIGNLDSRLDKQRFLEYNNSAFMIPKKFEFQGHRGDEIKNVISDDDIHEEMELRFRQLCKRLTALKTESEEVWKTLETAEKSLSDMINVKDYDCGQLFDDDALNRAGQKLPETVTLKLRADRQETEDFYLSKFREYTLGSNMMARLHAKYETMRTALGEANSRPPSGRSSSPASSIRSGSSVANRPFHRNSFLSQKPKRKRIGRTPMFGQPKLFGGSLEEYLEVTNQEIPLVMKSCIRIINLYGLHHQGVFRVSGAQVEINHFREAFERGEDPLSDVTDASDINSVAGVFKLYLREFREPLFPIYYFDQLMEISRLESKREFVTKVRDLVTSLPRPVFVVMRYLFAFLNHLSEFSDENMMDPYNLAICFGPTLLPIPEDKDQVQFQNLVNDLIKNIIMYQEEIFPQDGGIVYEKYISSEMIDENDVDEAPQEQINEEDSEADTGVGDDESRLKERDISLQIFGKSEVLEAVAQFDFVARSERELSFKKGDSLTLYSQVSNDWWKGSHDGHVGLIPDKYILLKMKDEDKDKGSSEENVGRRTSSSSDSLPNACVSSATKAISTSRLEERPSRVPLTQSASTPHIELRSPTSYNRSVSVSKESSHVSAYSVPLSRRSQSPTSKLLRPASSAVILPLREGRRQIYSEGSSPEEEDFPSITSTTVVPDSPSHSDAIDEVESPQELQHTLDKAFAQVFSSIKTLEGESGKKPLTKDTPDLVMDLPIGSNSSSPSVVTRSGRHDETTTTTVETMTAAERFAASNQSTLKKGSSRSSVPSSPSPQIEEKVLMIPRKLSSSSAPPSPCRPQFSTGVGGGGGDSPPGISTFKPQFPIPPPVKVKPPVMKKPTRSTASLGSQTSSSTEAVVGKLPIDFKELKQTSC